MELISQIPVSPESPEQQDAPIARAARPTRAMSLWYGSDATPEYVLESLIGSGGFAWIFSGYAVERAGEPPRPVVLKVLQPTHLADEDLVRDFRKEAAVGKRLRHPYLVRTEALLESSSGLAIVLENVDGPSLHDVLAVRRRLGEPLSPAVATQLIACAGEALAYAWEAPDTEGQPLHLVHRDIKPSNLMLTRRGVLRILDFGIARHSERTAVTKVGTFKGTTWYSAPEQAMGLGIESPASDLFSLGVTFYELLTLRRLFPQASEGEALRAVIRAEVAAPIAALRGELDLLKPILRCLLARNPLDRYTRGDELALELQRVLPELPGWDTLTEDLAALGQLPRRVTPSPITDQVRHLVSLPGVWMPNPADLADWLRRTAGSELTQPLLDVDPADLVPEEEPPYEPAVVESAGGASPVPAISPSPVASATRPIRMGTYLAGTALLLLGLTSAWVVTTPERTHQDLPLEQDTSAERMHPPQGMPIQASPILPAPPLAPATEQAVAPVAPAIPATPVSAASGIERPSSPRGTSAPGPKPPPPPLTPAPPSAGTPVAQGSPAEGEPPPSPPPLEAARPVARPSPVNVRINSRPWPVEVSVDGSLRARGPILSLPLEPGHHRVEIVTEDGRHARFTIDLKADEPRAFEWIFDLTRLVEAPLR